MDLERETPEPQPKEITPKAELPESSEQGEKPTVRIEETPEFKKSLGKSLKTINQQMSLREKEVTALKADLDKFKITHTNLQKEYDEMMERQFSEDPDARKAYFDRKSIDRERQKIAEEKVEVEKKLCDAEAKLWQIEMDKKAIELVKEIGIDVDEFVGCKTLEEMEVKALRYQLNNPKNQTPQKFDSGASSGGGINDVEFVKRFGSGDLPLTKENIDRYNKIKSSY